MPKKIRFESCKYHLLIALTEVTRSRGIHGDRWINLLDTLIVEYEGKCANIYIAGQESVPLYSVNLRDFDFYSRGDKSQSAYNAPDLIVKGNREMARKCAEDIIDLLEFGVKN